MQIRKYALAALLVAGSAHAQFGMSQAMNPVAMMNPLAMLGPMSMGGMGGGGMMNPMAMLAPVGMMAAPVLMPLGANMLSAQMYRPQSMMNPYLNPMAASNPYLNPSAGMANPYMMMQPTAQVYGGSPAYGGYGVSAAPAQAPRSFFPMMPATPAAKPAPAQALPMPFFPATSAPTPVPAAVAPKSVAPAAVSTPFDPAMWMQMMGGMAPATSGTPDAPTMAK